MICDMATPQTQAPAGPDPAVAREGKARWLGRLSPWVWGFGILIVIGVIIATQVPRLSTIVADKTKASPSATATGTPTLSGKAYTQDMIANRQFIRADLRGARLVHLDLRGKSFMHANAAGAVFAGSLLNGTDLSHADLRGADLRDTCLRGADLAGADLSGADFTGADVTGAIVTPGATSAAIAWASIPTSSVCPKG